MHARTCSICGIYTKFIWTDWTSTVHLVLHGFKDLSILGATVGIIQGGLSVNFPQGVGNLTLLVTHFKVEIHLFP